MRFSSGFSQTCATDLCKAAVVGSSLLLGNLARQLKTSTRAASMDHVKSRRMRRAIRASQDANSSAWQWHCDFSVF